MGRQDTFENVKQALKEMRLPSLADIGRILLLAGETGLLVYMAACSNVDTADNFDPGQPTRAIPTLSPDATETTKPTEEASIKLEGIISESDPSVVANFWSVVESSKGLPDQRKKGLTKDQIGAFSVSPKGEKTWNVDFTFFTDPTNGSDRLFVQNQKGQWIGLVPGITNGEVKWYSPLSAKIATPNPLYTPQPGETADTMEGEFYQVVFGWNTHDIAVGDAKSYFSPAKSIFGNAFIKGVAPEDKISLKSLPQGKTRDFFASYIIPKETAVPTLEPTKTPSPTEVPMTEADVENFYQGTYKGENGVTFDAANIVFKKNKSVIMTSKDYEKIKELAVNRSIAIFEKNKITVRVDPIVAAEAARDRGAAIIVGEIGSNPETILKASLAVANKKYEDGNTSIRVVVDEIHQNISYTSAMSLHLNFWVTHPEVMPKPKYIEVGHYSTGGRWTLEDAGITDLTDANWVETILAAGYDNVLLYAQKPPERK